MLKILSLLFCLTVVYVECGKPLPSEVTKNYAKQLAGLPNRGSQFLGGLRSRVTEQMNGLLGNEKEDKFSLKQLKGTCSLGFVGVFPGAPKPQSNMFLAKEAGKEFNVIMIVDDEMEKVDADALANGVGLYGNPTILLRESEANEIINDLFGDAGVPRDYDDNPIITSFIIDKDLKIRKIPPSQKMTRNPKTLVDRLKECMGESKLTHHLQHVDLPEGKCVLIVNTASKNDIFTKLNMEYLMHLKERFSDLVIGLVPSNAFGNEPMKDEDLITFFDAYQFPYFYVSKTDDFEKSDVYNFLKVSSIHPDVEGHEGILPEADFEKYLIGKDHKTVTHFGSNPGLFQTGFRLYDKVKECIES